MPIEIVLCRQFITSSCFVLRSYRVLKCSETFQALVCYGHECSYPEARELALKVGEHFEVDPAARLKINAAFGEKKKKNISTSLM
jgi:hypothetical protein